MEINIMISQGDTLIYTLAGVLTIEDHLIKNTSYIIVNNIDRKHGNKTRKYISLNESTCLFTFFKL